MLNAVIHVVEDDASLREALARLFQSADKDARFYGSAQEFLAEGLQDAPGCIVTDVRLPGIDGLEFQNQLGASGVLLPVIIMTGYGDIPMSVRAMKAGAVDFLGKPFSAQEMLDAVDTALRRDLERRNAALEIDVLQSKFESLTKREKEVFALVVAGRLNKQAAGDLGLSEIMVKIHRASIMKKMAARSLADLVDMAHTLGA